MNIRHRGRAARRVMPALLATAALLLALVPGAVAAPSGVVSGTLAIDASRSDAAVAVVTIVDQSVTSPAEPIIVGQQRLSAAGSGSIAFAVSYDPARIDPARSYAVTASVQDGATVYRNPQPVLVLTFGKPEAVKNPIALPQVTAPASVPITITKKDKTALGPNAVAIVALAKDPPVAGSVAQGINVAPGQAPITVAVPYNPDNVDPTATYVAKAFIVDGTSVWQTTEKVTFTPDVAGALSVPVTPLPTKLPPAPPTPAPTAAPTAEPTAAPTPTPEPTAAPTASPRPTAAPTATSAPTATPTAAPTATPAPTAAPTVAPTASPSPSPSPTASPTASPSPSASPTPGPTEGTVSGTLVYRENTKLSGGAKAVAALIDEGNGSSVAVVASQLIPTPGQQPVAFSITYQMADINPDRTYTVRGAIVDGDNAWVSEQGVDVLTGGNPSSGVVVPLTYRPDLLLGEVTGTLAGVEGPLGDTASSVTMVVDPQTGTVLGFDARPQAGAREPIPFAVPFNVADVDPDVEYVVVGEVTDGDSSWDTAKPPAVITDGNPTEDVVVPLVAVATPTPEPSPKPTPESTPEPTPAPAEGGGVPPWALLVVLAIAIGVVAAVIVARRGTTPPPAPGGDAGAAGAGAAGGTEVADGAIDAEAADAAVGAEAAGSELAVEEAAALDAAGAAEVEAGGTGAAAEAASTDGAGAGAEASTPAVEPTPVEPTPVEPPAAPGPDGA